MKTYKNPVYQEYFADPFVWRHEGEFYAIGTGLDEAEGLITSASRPTIFPLLRSSDLVNWSAAGRALVRPDSSVGDTFWAPEIAFADGQWWLYYSVGFADRMHQLRVAQSNHPLGPYFDAAALTERGECAFAIDPHPFRDDDGIWYLFHARDFLSVVDDQGRDVRPGTALVVSQLETMTRMSSITHTLARATCDWQRFAAQRAMYGGVYDWHTLEGPFVIKHAGQYFCIYSGGCWQTETYGVDFVVADTILGDYSDAGVATGPRILKTIPHHVIGPGHCSVVADARSNHWLAYHAWDPAMTARRLCIDPLDFTAGGPRARGPTWTQQTVSE
jgi:beta-xylosidase